MVTDSEALLILNRLIVIQHNDYFVEWPEISQEEANSIYSLNIFLRMIVFFALNIFVLPQLILMAFATLLNSPEK